MKRDNISPLGVKWSEFKDTLLTPEERDELEIKIQLKTEIIKARRENGITQKELEKASGVKQPVIARVENGKTDPQLSTMLRILRALGKTITIVPIGQNKHC